MAYEEIKKRTKLEKVLYEMKWEMLEGLIEPHFPKVGKGRPLRNMKVVLRIYCLQLWNGLSDSGAYEALYDMEPPLGAQLRLFAVLELGVDTIPQETCILKFPREIFDTEMTQDRGATLFWVISV